jgi:N-succinyldiaminopimelate aminotransferase
VNPNLAKLHPYPFERLRLLFQDVAPGPRYPAINLGIGERKHPTPEFIRDALTWNLSGLASYPATAGTPALREAIAAWTRRM